MPLPRRGSASSYAAAISVGILIGTMLMASPAIGVVLAALCGLWLIHTLTR